MNVSAHWGHSTCLPTRGDLPLRSEARQWGHRILKATMRVIQGRATMGARKEVNAALDRLPRRTVPLPEERRAYPQWMRTTDPRNTDLNKRRGEDGVPSSPRRLVFLNCSLPERLPLLRRYRSPQRSSSRDARTNGRAKHRPSVRRRRLDWNHKLGRRQGGLPGLRRFFLRSRPCSDS